MLTPYTLPVTSNRLRADSPRPAGLYQALAPSDTIAVTAPPVIMACSPSSTPSSLPACAPTATLVTSEALARISLERAVMSISRARSAARQNQSLARSQAKESRKLGEPGCGAWILLFDSEFEFVVNRARPKPIVHARVVIIE